MRPRSMIAVVATAAAVTMTACGSSTNTATSEDGFADLYVCVSDAAELAGFSASDSRDDQDLVAENAGVGAINVTGDNQGIQVVVERNEDDAKRTVEQYRVFAGALSGSVDDLLQRHGNVVVLYDKTPTDDERTIVEDCLDQ